MSICWVNVRFALESTSSATQLLPAAVRSAKVAVLVLPASVVMLPLKVVEAHRIAELEAGIVKNWLVNDTLASLSLADTTALEAAQAELEPTQNLRSTLSPARVPERVMVIWLRVAATEPVLRTVIGFVMV